MQRSVRSGAPRRDQARSRGLSGRSNLKFGHRHELHSRQQQRLHAAALRSHSRHEIGYARKLCFAVPRPHAQASTATSTAQQALLRICTCSSRHSACTCVPARQGAGLEHMALPLPANSAYRPLSVAHKP